MVNQDKETTIAIDIVERSQLCGQWVAFPNEDAICGSIFFKITSYLPMEDSYELDNERGWKTTVSRENVTQLLGGNK